MTRWTELSSGGLSDDRRCLWDIRGVMRSFGLGVDSGEPAEGPEDIKWTSMVVRGGPRIEMSVGTFQGNK